MDVKALYPRFPREEAREAVKSALNVRATQKISTDYVLKYMDYALENNFFSFDGKHYAQTEGTSIGSKLGMCYALLLFVDLINLFYSFIYLSIFLYFILLIYLFVYLYIYLFIYLFIYLPIYLYIYLFIYLSIYLFIHLLIYSSIYLFIYLLCIYLSFLFNFLFQ